MTTRSLTAHIGSSLDPRTEQVSWIAFRATRARPASVPSPGHVAEALRAFASVLEKTYDPGRTVALTRVATRQDDCGRASLELSIAVGVVGARGDTRADAEQCATVVIAALDRFPSPFAIERVDATSLLEPPRHLVAIRQRSVEVFDENESSATPSRFDRQLESWLDVAHVLLAHSQPVFLQATFLASAISAGETLQLERESTVAARIVDRAVDSANHVLARRAGRVLATLTDVAESLSGPVWVGEVVVGSDAHLPRSLIRALASAVTNELDVLHAHQAAPVVAARTSLLGGAVIEDAGAGVRAAMALGLPCAALRPRELGDLFSLTEAAHCFRWPVPTGDRGVPTIPSGGARALGAPRGLPTRGLRVGSDSSGGPVFVGAELESHALLVGGTGSGKSTAMLEIARHYLDLGRPFVVVEPHGDLTRAIRHEALARGREIALVDADERETLALELLGAAGRADGDDRRATQQAINRLLDGLTSHLPRDWAGPRFRQLAFAALEVALAASSDRTLGLADVGRMLIDREFLKAMLADTTADHAAAVLGRHMADNDSAGVGLWAASKFDDIAQAPGADRIFAPFGRGFSVSDIIGRGVPLVVNLGALPRRASGLLGQIVLGATVDYALGRAADEREPFPVFVDEAHRFPAANLVDALAEGRKFGLRLVLATQDLRRLDHDLGDALVANTSVKFVFRTGVADGALLSSTVGVPSCDLCGQANLSAFVQITGHAPFSVRLEPPPKCDGLPHYRRPFHLLGERPASRSVPALLACEPLSADTESSVMQGLPAP